MEICALIITLVEEHVFMLMESSGEDDVSKSSAFTLQTVS